MSYGIRNVMVNTKLEPMSFPSGYKKTNIVDMTLKSKLKVKLREVQINFMLKHKMIEFKHDFKETTNYSYVTIYEDRLWSSVANLYDEYRMRGIDVSQIIVGRDTYKHHVTRQEAITSPVFLDPMKDTDGRMSFMGIPVILHPLIEGVVLVPKRY